MRQISSFCFYLSSSVFLYSGRLIFIKDNTPETLLYIKLRIWYCVRVSALRHSFLVTLAPIALIICQLFKWCAFFFFVVDMIRYHVFYRNSNCEFLIIVGYGVIVVVSIQNYVCSFFASTPSWFVFTLLRCTLPTTTTTTKMATSMSYFAYIEK